MMTRVWTLSLLLSTLLLMITWTPAPAQAQSDREISGQVTDAVTGETLPGVNVFVPSTKQGTATGIDGTYTLTVSEEADSLSFSYVGYETMTVPLAGRTEIDVALAPATLEAGELVVTALGIERESRTIGYSVQEVEGSDLSQTAELNVINSLQGQLAGVQVQPSGTGPGGSSRIVIRGIRFLGSSNQPLIVLDGIPIQGGGRQQTGSFGGFDYGGGIGDIDPNSIASLTVLRGGNAAALYGSRGANGAIVIETKKGTQETEVTVSSQTTAGEPLVLPDLQNEYGRGNNGTLTQGSDGIPVVPAGDISWGPRMEGQDVRDWTGSVQPYSPQPNNVEDLFDTSYSTNNSISFATGNETATARATISNVQSAGTLPGNELDRTNISLASSADLSDRFTVDGRVGYVAQSAFNRVNVAKSPDNPIYNAYYFPRNLRLSDLEDFRTSDGDPRLWLDESAADFSTRNNPYWTVNLNTNEDERRRVLGYMRLKYDFADWLNGFIRGGTDYNTLRREVRVASGTSYKVAQCGSDGSRRCGEYLAEQTMSQETTFDALLDGERELTDDVTGRLGVGGEWRFERGETTGTSGSGLSIPNFFTAGNLTSPTPTYGFSEKEVRSLYALFTIRYRDYLFLDLTARNEWSSTLPEDNNSYFYPSATAGFIFSDIWGPSWLSFGKFRASVAQVGSDTFPYRTMLEYDVQGQGHAGQSFGSVQVALPGVDLKPEMTTTTEAGLDLEFVDGRFALSSTYYLTNTRNQILDLPIPPASGWRSGIINAGKVRNEGVELRFEAAAVDGDDFQWDIDVNWSTNASEIVKLTDDIDTYELSSDLGVTIEAREGEPFGQIYGTAYQRTDDGRRIVDQNGLPVGISSDSLALLGNFQADWVGGVSNTFRYKGIGLSVLLDVKKGGDIFSLSNAVAAQQGTAAFTVDGREAFYNGNGGIVAEGVVNTGTASNPTYEENTQAVDPQAYWSRVGGEGGITEEFVYDASYVKLRQVTLSYRLPSGWIQPARLQSARVSVFGRNLAYLFKNTPGFDPESTYSTSLSNQGREAFAYPPTRSIGFSLNLTL
ncbi:hypothetical protein CRI94_04115 [Longibacter salinarum]|uniref:TonB-dependent receptor plug domain-containing protein n=1 Tax=Longibacter salinarum TaxID=1850348 RepID=A0A2A8CZV4_9BACT|nr:SusC/RagA family TonB-linked outer membrane protein [Longibacter salinarum]PEN14232.1 hypothetical protein CRI94_04115 [Longibacter salinarum]